MAPVPMLQYPAAMLCTELAKRVGEISRPSRVSAWQSSWQLSPSPPEEENTLASSAGFASACAAASRPTANASLTTRPVRRRSAAARMVGIGSTVAADL